MKDNPVSVINMEPMGDISSPDNLSPEGLGFMCGLEIHQQLATGKAYTMMLPTKEAKIFEAHKNQILQASIQSLYLDID